MPSAKTMCWGCFNVYPGRTRWWGLFLGYVKSSVPSEIKSLSVFGALRVTCLLWFCRSCMAVCQDAYLMRSVMFFDCMLA